MPGERLQKIIAAAGIASRRKAEQLIAGGLVSVNGNVVTELGSKADAEHDHIRVNGKLLRGPERHIYLLLNKPKGYVTTLSDPEGRPTVTDLLRGAGARVYPVGRLDYASEGLLLLTNDGDLDPPADESGIARSEDLRGESGGQAFRGRSGEACGQVYLFRRIGADESRLRPRRSARCANPTIPGMRSL